MKTKVSEAVSSVFGKKEEVAPDHKALAPQADQLPALSPADAAAMYGGELQMSDLTIPRLVLLEGLSPQVTKEKLGHPGDLFVTGLNANLGSAPREFVLLQRRPTSRLLWRDLAEGGGILCRADDAKHGVGAPGGACATCPKSQSHTGATGDWTPPECDENQNLIVVDRAALQSGDAIPYALSGSKGRLKEFKNLNTMLLPLMSARRPLYAKSLLVTVKPRDSKTVKNAVFHVFTFAWGNDNAALPAAEQAAAQQLLARFGSAKIAEPEEVVSEAVPF